MKKLYYSLIVLLVVFVGLVMPKVNAAGDFDDDAHSIGYIDYYERDVNNNITGAWVYIVDSSVSFEPRYFWFNPTYFQPDILTLQDELLGKILIWNPFDESGEGDYDGRWWLLTGYVGDDIADAYQAGYESGYNDGRSYGYGIGYQDGYGAGQIYGFDQGYAVGGQIGYQNGYNEGYGNGFADGREQVLNSIESMEILYQDVVLPNGVQDEIVDNETLVDRVGVVVFDGSESDWQFVAFAGSDTITFRYDVALNAVQGSFSSMSNFFVIAGNLISVDYECYVISSELKFYVRILKNRLPEYQDSWTSIEKVNAFKQWLAEQKNAGEPLTLWYQYSEPSEYDLMSLLTNEDGSYKDGYNIGYNEGRVHVQRENKSLLSVIPTTIGSIWLMISDFLSYEVFGLNLWSIIMMFAGFSLLILIIKMVI